jgi:pectinesterase
MTTGRAIVVVGLGERCRTIAAALEVIAEAPEPEAEIRLQPGRYWEKIAIPAAKPLTIIGAGAARTVVAFDDSARRVGPDGTMLGTLRTPTLTVDNPWTTLRDLTIANTAAPRQEVGQAVALSVKADYVRLERVSLFGYQDTLYLAGRASLLRRCRIQGDVDFIFGPGAALLDRCDIKSVGPGYVTAASTPAGEPWGFLFWGCRFSGSGRTYLGRPWRPYGRVVLAHCWLGPHVAPAGWDNWRNPDNERTARFAEYGSRGPGAVLTERVAWATVGGAEDVPRDWAPRTLLAAWGYPAGPRTVGSGAGAIDPFSGGGDGL